MTPDWLLLRRYAKENSSDKLEAYTLLATAIQSNPKTVKLLMAYVREAKGLEFDDFANGAIETLRLEMPSSLFKKFILSESNKLESFFFSRTKKY